MLGTMQRPDALNGQQVRTDTADPGTHLAQHVTQLLDIGFAGGIIDGGGTFGHRGSHDDVGSTCD